VLYDVLFVFRFKVLLCKSRFHTSFQQVLTCFRRRYAAAA
jgi:hypothetical protein